LGINLLKIIMKNIIKYISLVFIVLACFACDNNEVYHGSVSFDKAEWKLADEAVFDVVIADTLSTYNIYVEVRNTSDYEKSNLWVMLSCKYPNGGIKKDTINCFLADKRGYWLGSGLGDLFATRHFLKENVPFLDSGNYKFTLVHGMRSPDIKGVNDIGISIEKFEKK